MKCFSYQQIRKAMKAKHSFLALAAIIFAVGSAFSFKDVTSTVWVKIRYAGRPPGQFDCINTGKYCNGNGPACKVTITDLGADALARLDMSCPTPLLFHSLTSGIAGEYDDIQSIVEINNN